MKVNLTGVLGDHCKEMAVVSESLIHRLSMSFQLCEKTASLCVLAAGSLKTRSKHAGFSNHFIQIPPLQFLHNNAHVNNA